MTIVEPQYRLKIAGYIRAARKQGAIAQHEADYLKKMAKRSFAAASTAALIRDKGAPDFLYAALYFSTLIWQSGEAAAEYIDAHAGYKLAQYVLSQELPGYDPQWATRLLLEFFDAHQESTGREAAHPA